MLIREMTSSPDVQVLRLPPAASVSCRRAAEMPKHTIAIVSTYPSDHRSFTGGVETATAALLEGLRGYQDEFNVHVVCVSRQLRQDLHEARDGVQFHFLGGLHRRWLRPRLPLRVLKVSQQLRRLQPDLVHCQANPDLALAASLAGFRPLFTIHGISEREATLRTGWQS